MVPQGCRALYAKISLLKDYKYEKNKRINNHK